jgi:hypothetical protein
MSTERRPAVLLAMVMVASCAMIGSAFAQRCHVEVGTNIVDCTPYTLGGFPIDSTGGLSVFVADLAHQPVSSDPGFSALSKGGPAVGVLITGAGGAIPALTLASRRVVAGVHAIALLANAPVNGGIPAGAAPVAVQQVGDSTGMRVLATLPEGSSDSLKVELRSGSTVVRSMSAFSSGSVARFSGWPTGFSVRSVAGGIEYTWRLGAMRSVRLTGMTPGSGDRVVVTVPGAGGAFSPVLLRGVGFDQLSLAPATPSKGRPKPSPRPKPAAAAK